MFTKVTGLFCLKSSKISFQRKFHQYLKKNIWTCVFQSYLLRGKKITNVSKTWVYNVQFSFLRKHVPSSAVSLNCFSNLTLELRW
jgi:hypothetical protein